MKSRLMRVSERSVLAAKVSGNPASGNRLAHTHSSDGEQSADTIAQPGYLASTNVQYTLDEGSSRRAAQYNALCI